MRIENKRQMFQMLRNGVFGNHMRVWNSSHEMLNDGYGVEELIGLRYQGPKHGKWFRTGMTLDEAQIEYTNWILEDGLSKSDILWCEYLPLEDIVWQFECLRDYRGLTVRHHTVNLPHRGAMFADGVQEKTGLAAGILLDYYLEKDDLDWIKHLMHTHPDCIIEATVTSKPYGSLKRKMVIWEVRNY